jgi:hypothetical protein
MATEALQRAQLPSLLNLGTVLLDSLCFLAAWVFDTLALLATMKLGTLPLGTFKTGFPGEIPFLLETLTVPFLATLSFPRGMLHDRASSLSFQLSSPILASGHILAVGFLSS